jgi:hypothetical protein
MPQPLAVQFHIFLQELDSSLLSSPISSYLSVFSYHPLRSSHILFQGA